MFGDTTTTTAPPAGGLFGSTNNNQSAGAGIFGNLNQNFVVNATGHAEIPFPAERALINVLVSSSGTNKASVSDEVITTAKHLEGLMRDLSPKDESADAKAAAALAHWSKTNLTSTSHVPWTGDGKEAPRQYTATIKFDIRFKEFKALGAFSTRLSALQHVEVQSINWILTAATEKAHRSEMRKLATQDALERARDYCEVLGCTNIRPVELREGAHNFTPGQSLFGASSRSMPTSYTQVQTAPGYQPAGGLFGGTAPPPDGGAETRIEGDLEFRPEEVKMSVEVSVKFHATYAQPEMMASVR